MVSIFSILTTTESMKTKISIDFSIFTFQWNQEKFFPKIFWNFSHWTTKIIIVTLFLIIHRILFLLFCSINRFFQNEIFLENFSIGKIYSLTPHIPNMIIIIVVVVFSFPGYKKQQNWNNFLKHLLSPGWTLNYSLWIDLYIVCVWYPDSNWFIAPDA